MPIKITLGELVASVPTLEKLTRCEFSFTTNYRLARRLKTINDELATYNKLRDELVKDLGSPSENGSGQIQLFKVSDEQLQKAIQDLESCQGELNFLIQTGVESKMLIENCQEKETKHKQRLELLNKNIVNWPIYEQKHSELLKLEVDLAIDPIPLSLLKPQLNAACDKCGTVPHSALNVHETMLLIPLLIDDVS